MKVSRVVGSKIIGLLMFALLGLVNLYGSEGVKLGQSRTLLPDGQILLLGGFDTAAKPVTEASLGKPTVSPIKLSTQLQVARAGHTATVLPDGKVLIFGGVGLDGQMVSSTEVFDPATQSFSVLADVTSVPRAFHTANLLSNGNLLLAGGVEAGNEFPEDVQIWHFRTHKAKSEHALLSIPREGHSAILRSDGTVCLSGGTDKFGQKVTIDECYDPVDKRFHQVTGAGDSSSEAGATPGADAPTIAASIPTDGGTDFSIQGFIAMRLSRLLDGATVTAANFVLTDANATVVPAKVTAAEGGRLTFVIPTNPLEAGVTYTLRIDNVIGRNGVAMAPATITFTTEGVPAETSGPDWVPDRRWRSEGESTKFQELPPLQAAGGVTALSGQVLKLSGWPLENATLEINGKKMRTDHTGRFLMQNLPPGHAVLWIDASTANGPNASYGTYEVGVTLQAGKTNVLNYTIWMTKLDKAHAVTIASPTSPDQETVITNPAMPGFELRLPANTTIVDRYGKAVRQITITPVPLNKPPFPLPPGVKVEIYFTIQPGGAFIRVGNNWDKGAHLIYPNSYHLGPGTPFNFWNYDAEVKGWFIYGGGHVTTDAQSVVPDPGVEIYRFTGAMDGSNGGGPQGCPSGGCPDAGDPVSLATGSFTYDKTDLVLPDVIPVTWGRSYLTNDSFPRSFGIGATDPYDIFLIGDMFPYTYQELILPNGARVRFDRISPGTSYIDAAYIHVSAQDEYYGAVLSGNAGGAAEVAWKLVLKDKTTMYFPEASQSTNPYCQAVTRITDRYGNTVNLDRTSKSNSPTGCNLTKITSPNGRYISLTHDTQGRITQAQDHSGRTVKYAYDAPGRLTTVTDANGGITRYTYDDQNRMLTIQDARGIVYLTNKYDSTGRVVEQIQADGGSFQFQWTPTANTNQDPIGWRGVGSTLPGQVGRLMGDPGCWDGVAFNHNAAACIQGYLPLVAQVDVTDPRGYVREVKFGPTGYTTSDTHALGQPEQQTVTYTYYSDNLLQSFTDALGRTASYTYDNFGNPTTVTKLSGTPDAVTTSFSYEPVFQKLASVTDPLGHVSGFSYDRLGNLAKATDPLGHDTTFSYNEKGQLLSAADVLNQTTQLAYFGADLSTITDPLGNVSTQFADSLGRTTSSVDALGNITKHQYNNLNLPTQTTDAQGNNTVFNYDANGNLLSLIDALGHTTSYTYDNMDRAITRTDPLNRQELYTYDPNGNMASVTDRKGQVKTFAYDGLGRTTTIGFGFVGEGGVTSYESTKTYSYDQGNRMVRTSDSTGGVIVAAYDTHDHLLSETTSHGQITYAYDIAGRRTAMTVNGQPAIGYFYDNGNRLTQITQAGSSTSFSYDSSNRRSSLTLPNGIVALYTYDADSRLTGLTYQMGPMLLGSITYTYDQLGRRVQVGGSFARTGIPGAVSAATYDAANQVTNWNGTALSYDANGNMTSDGANLYTWNARGQLAAISGGVSASFAYDAFGRRTGKSINRNSLGFAYNAGSIVQELSGDQISANLWNGGTSYFQRTDASGSMVPLTDALGSVLALVDANGAIKAQYTYDPFGNTTASGTANGNTAQYIGQENDDTGLYYFHARYYSPKLQRFISEDPIGFQGGGVNLHSYSYNSPINFKDPGGKSPCVVGALAGSIVYNSYVIYETLNGRKINKYAGWSGLWNLAKGNAEAATTGCMIADGVASAAGALTEAGEAAEGAEALEGSCCFVGGTPVHTRSGAVAIEKIKIGDEVLSRNPGTGALEYKKVKALTVPHLSKLLELRVEGEPEPLRPNGEHQFFVKRIPAKQGDWVRADQTQVGDLVLTAKGKWRKIMAITPIQREDIVYNFEVEDNHDFFVGTSGLLVHNDVCFYHGTDASSATDIVESGLDVGKAAEKGGGDVFWTTTEQSDAEIFATTNHVGGAPAVVSVTVPESVVTSLQSAKALEVEGTVYKFLPKAWKILNKIGFLPVQ